MPRPGALGDRALPWMPRPGALGDRALPWMIHRLLKRLSDFQNSFQDTRAPREKIANRFG
jgi:hypothetical protein